MELIFEDRKRRAIKGQEELKFSSYSSYHLVKIAARAKGEKQLEPGATDDEDLTLTLDGRGFPKLDTQADLIDSPAAFSGGNLHGLAKTIYLLTFLKGRDHRLVLNADDPPGTATFESLEVYTLDLSSRLTINVQDQAEDGDRRPWLTFAFAELPLVSFAPNITYRHRKRDSDDLKIIVDGNTQGNFVRTIKHFLWRFVGSLLPEKFPARTEEETFYSNLPRGLHYLEFHADRMPTLHSLALDLGNLLPASEDIPSVNKPKWTGDFYDDPPEMVLARVILGEAEGASEEAKTWVGWTIKNRILAQRKEEWGLTFHEVILKENQYEAFVKKERLERMEDPLNTPDEEVRHVEIPYWATKEREKGVVDNLHFYKL